MPALTETIRFGSLRIRFDERVLRPRPWTVAQPLWAAELADEMPPGPLLELCAGVGHMGLLLGSLVPRDLVLVDADEVACAHARANADAAALPGRVEVRQARVDEALAGDERFAVILADPPWVASEQTWRFPEDPVDAIDGGDDGLALARVCVETISRHLGEGGVAILQLGDRHQAVTIDAELTGRPGLGLRLTEVRADPGGGGVLARLARRGAASARGA